MSTESPRIRAASIAVMRSSGACKVALGGIPGTLNLLRLFAGSPRTFARCARLRARFVVRPVTRPASFAAESLVVAHQSCVRKCATIEILDSSPGESLFDRAYRFGRAVIVGSGATAIDFLVLTSCIRVAGLAPVAARLPALIAGATFQFFGNRTFAFRAQGGSISRQARLFVAAELVALLVNFWIYRWLIPRIAFLPPEVTSLLGTFIVFITFGYPVRRLIIFRIPDPAGPEPELRAAALAAPAIVEPSPDAASAREQARLEAEKFREPR